jgi:acyl-CoA hydrolase
LCRFAWNPSLFGVGGQIDFIYGASLSEREKAIIAIPSTPKKGESKKQPVSKPERIEQQEIISLFVTEYGAVNLYVKSCRKEPIIISVANPNIEKNMSRLP